MISIGFSSKCVIAVLVRWANTCEGELLTIGLIFLTQDLSEHYLPRSFIKGFTKKPYRTQDQTKLIFDFLDFIAGKMRECEVWANVSDTEFENATEAMEKLVMNRLYAYTFSPAVRREGKWSVQTDDLERDRVLKQRINLFTWVTEEHLDVPRGDHSKGFIDFAMQGEESDSSCPRTWLTL